MDVRVGLRGSPNGNTPARYYYTRPIQEKLPTTQKKKAGAADLECSIRDSVKLLQLAERIQTSSGSKTGKTPSLASPTPTSIKITNNNNINKIKTPGSGSGSGTISIRTPLTKTTPKINSSYSSRNNFSSNININKISDPAKTNIEHLVNYRCKSDSGASESATSTIESESSGKRKSFHNKNESNFLTPLKVLQASFNSHRGRKEDKDKEKDKDKMPIKINQQNVKRNSVKPVTEKSISSDNRRNLEKELVKSGRKAPNVSVNCAVLLGTKNQRRERDKSVCSNGTKTDRENGQRGVSSSAQIVSTLSHHNNNNNNNNNSNNNNNHYHTGNKGDHLLKNSNSSKKSSPNTNPNTNQKLNLIPNTVSVVDENKSAGSLNSNWTHPNNLKNLQAQNPYEIRVNNLLIKEGSPEKCDLFIKNLPQENRDDKNKNKSEVEDKVGVGENDPQTDFHSNFSNSNANTNTNTNTNIKLYEDASTETDADAASASRRLKSRSLPKSFLSLSASLLKNGHFPSVSGRNEEILERFEEEKSTCPNPEVAVNPYQSVKMRLQKAEEVRPKSLSLDYSRRNSWMKLYRDIEINAISNNNNNNDNEIGRREQELPFKDFEEDYSPVEEMREKERERRERSKGSIHKLELIEPEDLIKLDPLKLSNNNNLEIRIPHPPPLNSEPGSSPNSCRTTSSATNSSNSNSNNNSSGSGHQSLFQRFSKTFSLRFGGGSKKNSHHKGSTPDLSQLYETENLRNKNKMRKESKSSRGEKCHSGDSGIQLEENSVFRSKKIRERPPRPEYITGNSHLQSVEIEDQEWDTLKTTDDGFVSSEEDVVDATDADADDPVAKGHYHSLPLKYARQKKNQHLLLAKYPPPAEPPEVSDIRGKVIREIVSTEENYVKTLNDIVQGFLIPCRSRTDLFTPQVIYNIFSNIENILMRHIRFLDHIKSQLNPDDISLSLIGHIFSIWADRFDLYSEYCCNHPLSMATVKSLTLNPAFSEFFEACRRLQLMDKLPLHGFLLRPIQRICQYHLLLSDLVKHTMKSHEDYYLVVEAAERMKGVASKINDTQRIFDSLQDVQKTQNSIDAFEGPDLIDRNAMVIQKGELVKMTEGKKSKEVFVILLSNELVYCKKDFLKRNGLVFAGRINLSLHVWLNIDSNEEDDHFGMVLNSFRVYSQEKNSWVLFTANSPAEKRKWITALEKTAEDPRVDWRMRQMAKVTTIMQLNSELQGLNSSTHHQNQSSIHSSKKTKKGNVKVDSDSMLIEVGKIKQQRANSVIHNNNNKRERNSKFYI